MTTKCLVKARKKCSYRQKTKSAIVHNMAENLSFDKVKSIFKAALRNNSLLNRRGGGRRKKYSILSCGYNLLYIAVIILTKNLTLNVKTKYI